MIIGEALRSVTEAEKTNRFGELIAALGAVVGVLFAARQYVQLADRRGRQSSRVHGFLNPRYLSFEYLFGVTLWNRQLELVENLLQCNAKQESSVVQLLMGQGKSSVVSPLMALPIIEKLRKQNAGGVLVACVPRSLVRQTIAVLGHRFTSLTGKTPLLFQCDRGRGDLKHLRHKVETAAKFGNLLLASPESIKSCLLRAAEIADEDVPEAPPGQYMDTVFAVSVKNQSSMYWDVWGAGRTSPVCLNQLHNGYNQRFLLHYCGSGTWTIHPEYATELALTAVKVDEAVAVRDFDPRSDAQRWTVEPADDRADHFIVQSQANLDGAFGLVLSYANENSGTPVTVAARNNTSNQQFAFHPFDVRVTAFDVRDRGLFYIKPRNTEHCVHLHGGGIEAGAKLSQHWPCGRLHFHWVTRRVAAADAAGADGAAQVTIHPRYLPRMAIELGADNRTLTMQPYDRKNVRQRWRLVHGHIAIGYVTICSVSVKTAAGAELVWTIDTASTEKWTIATARDDGDVAQHMQFEPIPLPPDHDGTSLVDKIHVKFYLRTNLGKAWDCFNASKEPGCIVGSWDQHGGWNQMFVARQVHPGWFALLPRYAQHLAVEMVAIGQDLILQPADPRNLKQMWQRLEVEPGYYMIISGYREGGREVCLDATHGNPRPVAASEPYPFRQFAVHFCDFYEDIPVPPLDGGVYQLSPLSQPTKILDVTNYQSHPTTPVQLWDRWGKAPNQTFAIERHANGGWSLQAKHSGNTRLGYKPSLPESAQPPPSASAPPLELVLPENDTARWTLIPLSCPGTTCFELVGGVKATGGTEWLLTAAAGEAKEVVLAPRMSDAEACKRQRWCFTEVYPPGRIRSRQLALGTKARGEKVREDLEHLQAILAHFHKGVVLVDEVDSVMAPLTSELNFPTGIEALLPMGAPRWRFAVDFLSRSLSVLRAGVEAKAVQVEPHLCLVDAKWYRLPGSGGVDAVVVAASGVLTQTFGLALDQASVKHFLVTANAAMPAPLASLSREVQTLLCLARQWVHYFFPHVMSKVNRVNYGLSENEKRLAAVPYLAKDVPSERSEFAHPDIVIGLTYLAYLYDGLRRCDVKELLKLLLTEFGSEKGPASGRATYALFEGFFSQTPDRTNLPPIDMINPEEPATLARLHAGISRSPQAIDVYLDRVVYPRALKFAPQKLSACGQEIGNNVVFAGCLGFTGTSDDLVPSATRVQHAIEDTTTILHTLCDTRVTSAVELPPKWTAAGTLDLVADAGFDALIDAGGLITGFDNAVVAARLLARKKASAPSDVFSLHNKDCVVFLDAATDRPCFLRRDATLPRPLAECTVPLHRRFVFFDQVHCTGVDIQQATDARAALLIGKDMVFRDLAQAAWRMRRLGPNGQTVVCHVTPEVAALARRDADGSAAALGASWTPSLLNVTLTRLVALGAEKVGMNERKLLQQEQQTPRRRAALAALVNRVDDSADARQAFSEAVDYTVSMAPLEGSLETEVIQQQQNEQQKEQLRLEQRIKGEASYAVAKAWPLTHLQCRIDTLGDAFVALRTVPIQPPENPVIAQVSAFPRDMLATSNYLRVGASCPSKFDERHPMKTMRNVGVILQWGPAAGMANPEASCARWPEGGGFVHCLVSLQEAEALRRHLSFGVSAVPKNIVPMLWTRRGSPLTPLPAPVADAARPVLERTLRGPAAVLRFYNCDMWYTDDELAALEKELFASSSVGVKKDDDMRTFETFLRFAAAIRRRENQHLGTSSLCGRIIPTPSRRAPLWPSAIVD